MSKQVLLQSPVNQDKSFLVPQLNSHQLNYLLVCPLKTCLSLPKSLILNTGNLLNMFYSFIPNLYKIIYIKNFTLLHLFVLFVVWMVCSGNIIEQASLYRTTSSGLEHEGWTSISIKNNSGNEQTTNIFNSLNISQKWKSSLSIRTQKQNWLWTFWFSS